MHESLLRLRTELQSLAETIKNAIPSDEPLGIAHGNWSFPALTKSDLAWRASKLADLIDTFQTDSLTEIEKNYYDDYIRKLAFVKAHTIPQLWANAQQAVPAYMVTLDILQEVLTQSLKPDESAKLAKNLKRVSAQTRGMEARLKDLNPRIDQLHEILGKIEAVHEAADSFPEDIENLKDARNKIERLISDAEKDRVQIGLKKDYSDETSDAIKIVKSEADEALLKCQEAYRASTSQGLAAAFIERSKALSWSMWVWVVGLVSSLALGGIFGSKQIEKLSDSLTATQTNTDVIIFNLLLALLSVGAPIWFSWISTKQINQRFKLAEDYAFKASISRAYEGYRSEAARLDKELELSLLTSALNRLDEIPLRLIEPISHGSPAHELLSSDLIKKAIATVPNFISDTIKLADTSLNRLAHGKPLTVNTTRNKTPDGETTE